MEKNFKKVKGDVNKLRKAKIKVEILSRRTQVR